MPPDHHEISDVAAVVEELEHHHTFEMRETSISRGIDRVVGWIGEAFSWLWLVLLVVIIGNVFLRYAFSQGMIELEELQWYLYAAAWLVGLSYTFIHDGHVRVDVLHERLGFRAQMWLELLGLLLLFLPFVCFVIYFSVPFCRAVLANQRDIDIGQRVGRALADQGLPAVQLRPFVSASDFPA